MAVTVDQTSLGFNFTATLPISPATVHTTTAAVAAGAYVVINLAWFGTGTVSAVTIGGNSMTLLKAGTGTSTSDSESMWGFPAPSGLASGQAIVVTYSGTIIDMGAGGMSLNGVDTTTPVASVFGPTSDTTAAWTSASATIPAGGIMVAGAFNEGFSAQTHTAASGSTESYEGTGDGNGYAMVYRIDATGGSFTVGGTFSTTANAGVNLGVVLNPAGGGGAAPTVFPRSTYYAPSRSPYQTRKFRVQPLPQAITPPSGTTPVSDGDTGSGTEDATVVASITGTDTGTGTDTASVAATETASDTGTGTDTASYQGQYPVSDTGSGTDTASLTANESGTDTGTGADTASVAAAETGSDTGSGTDTASVSVTVTATDTATGVDTASVTVNITASDTGTFVDTANASGGTTPSGQDTGTGADLATVAAALAAADTVLGTDLASLVASLVAADTGAGTDTASVTTSGNAPDTGHGTDTASYVGSYPVSDTGTAAQTASVSASVSAADTGTFVDTATLTVTITVADAAAGVDLASVFNPSAGVDVTVILVRGNSQPTVRARQRGNLPLHGERGQTNVSATERSRNISTEER